MNALDESRQCPDVATLKPAWPRMCERFGRIARRPILTAIPVLGEVSDLSCQWAEFEDRSQPRWHRGVL
ncbi:MAG: hypothetical protein Q8K05_05740 [Polaromonas sp.]|uniref:hypothetical protein n=1 Tax=Polaromonas sp. TaxID=1869339 RepID=UPI00273027EA|nr:hypothetical protein [Polaromonas sp.]MDP2255546.1 hypothetical protein [Polaromonas sp.]MDP3708510.1 hypothetical protein [Polaromonas sp.]